MAFTWTPAAGPPGPLPGGQILLSSGVLVPASLLPFSCWLLCRVYSWDLVVASILAWATSLGACPVITLDTAPGSRTSGPWALSVALISASGPRHLPLSESCHPAFRRVRLPFMPTPRHCLGLSSLSSGACCSFTRPIPGPPAPWLLLTAWLLAHLPGPVFYTVLPCSASFLPLPGSPGPSTSSGS